jgi:hypothetical protein
MTAVQPKAPLTFLPGWECPPTITDGDRPVRGIRRALQPRPRKAKPKRERRPRSRAPLPAQRVFGRWTILADLPGRGERKVRCRCECGTERELPLRKLTSGASLSCGNSCRVLRPKCADAVRVLRAAGGSIKGIARELGINKKTVQRRVREMTALPPRTREEAA